MMNNLTSYKQLQSNLEYLKLKQVLLNLDTVIEFSEQNNLSFVDTLVKLTNYEIDVREQNMILSMVKVAAFPYQKELKDFDFEFQPSIN